MDTAKDTYRATVLGSNRLAEFNRFENIVYNNSLERRADLNLSNDNETYRVGFGKTTSEIWSREGLLMEHTENMKINQNSMKYN